MDGDAHVHGLQVHGANIGCDFRFPSSFACTPASSLPGLQILLFLPQRHQSRFALGCALAVRLSARWYAAEMARSKAELERAEAELQSLKSQISPHFLLNTLNNIYALTAIDSVKAQAALLELSKMLRYQLYEEFGSRVSVEREVEFLQNYVALMRLRLNQNVEVTTDFHLVPHKEMNVAPHIFISLVENAFKHGVSTTAPSHVHLRLDCDGQRLNFDCRKQLFPSTQTPKHKWRHRTTPCQEPP